MKIPSKIQVFLLTATLLFLGSCKQTGEVTSTKTVEPAIQTIETKPQMLAVLYHQTAAEYRALCYQAFNLASWKLEEAIRNRTGSKKLSIVVDLDETMLDNSPYEAKCLVEGIQYPEGWVEWMNASIAEAVPGALDFLNFARERGVEVYYISNRSEKYFNQTLKNLQRLNFPYAAGDHLLLKRSESSKKGRRQRVAEQTETVLFVGDNLNDFSEIFENTSVEERATITDRFRDKFGDRFIVLPNLIYGDWLLAVYNYDNTLDPAAKASLMEKALNPF